MTTRSPRDGGRLAHRLQSVSLRHLRFFAALAREANFSRAAERMKVSQPALSAAIRQIEASLDLKLFDRTTHYVSPTDAGRALLPHVHRLLVTADNAFADMADAAAHHRITVRIGAIPSAIPIVARRIGAVRGESAEPLEIMLCDGKSDELVAQVRNGSLDLAVCVHPHPDPALDAVPLMDDGMVLLTHPGHRFAGLPSLAWSELTGDEIVHFSGGSIGELASAAMRQHDLAPSARYRIDQVDSLYGIVSAGLAVGIMPRLYTTGLGWNGVAMIPLTEPSIVRRLLLLSRHDLASEFPAGHRIVRSLAASMVDRAPVAREAPPMAERAIIGRGEGHA